MIEVTGITKRYGDTLAVDDLSFEVRPGQITGFLGPNGSGKSTTMRMIMGLDNPDAGHAKVNGTSYEGLGWPLREVGALLEAKAIHPGRSARNHLWMLAQTNDIPRSRVDEVLEIVGLAAVGRLPGLNSISPGRFVEAEQRPEPSVLRSQGLDFAKEPLRFRKVSVAHGHPSVASTCSINTVVSKHRPAPSSPPAAEAGPTPVNCRGPGRAAPEVPHPRRGCSRDRTQLRRSSGPHKSGCAPFP